MSANADTNDMRGDVTAADTQDVLAAVPDQREGLSRRTVLKGAAHAAWAVPAVQIATMAPAMAAVSGPADLSGSSISGIPQWVGGAASAATLPVTVSLSNKNTAPTENLTVTFSFPVGFTPTASAAGWSVSGVGTNILSFTPDSQLAGNGTKTLAAVFAASSLANAGRACTQVTVSATSTNGTPAQMSFDVAAVPNVVATATGAWAGKSNAWSLPVKVTLTNRTAAATSGLKQEVKFPPGWSPTTSALTSGWSVTSSGNSTTGITFAFTPPSQFSSMGSMSFDVTFTPSSPSNMNKTVELALHPALAGNQIYEDRNFTFNRV